MWAEGGCTPKRAQPKKFQMSRSLKHTRVRDFMSATNVGPWHTCLPLSVLCLQSLTLNLCPRRKNLENRACSRSHTWRHYWEVSSQGSKSEGGGRGWEWVPGGTYAAGHSIDARWGGRVCPDRHGTLFPGIGHQREEVGVCHLPAPAHQLTLAGQRDSTGHELPYISELPGQLLQVAVNRKAWHLSPETEGHPQPLWVSQMGHGHWNCWRSFLSACDGSWPTAWPTPWRRLGWPAVLEGGKGQWQQLGSPLSTAKSRRPWQDQARLGGI